MLLFCLCKVKEENKIKISSHGSSMVELLLYAGNPGSNPGHGEFITQKQLHYSELN